MLKERNRHRWSDDLVLAPYAERREARTFALDRAVLRLLGGLEAHVPKAWLYAPISRAILDLEPSVAALSDHEILKQATELRPHLLRRGFAPDLVAKAFAFGREMTWRRAGMRHFPVQLIGGLALLDGALAEMETGEGKTIVAVLPAITAALAGTAVHIVTVNDYLAKRDAEALAPIYQGLGLTVGLVQTGQDAGARKAAYACDIAYCTGKELVFDYLRDCLAIRQFEHGAATGAGRARSQRTIGNQLLLRGLEYAIIDEADSILIDEARTPLIISAERPDATNAARYRAALAIAHRLEAGAHYHLLVEDRAIRLTLKGAEMVAAHAQGWSDLWKSSRARNELIERALTALHIFQRDKHYIVSGGKVQIVDEYTGRTMPDRSWEHGLHQLIETKEGCDPTNLRDSVAQITYQRFFRRYERLAGMTGTAAEVAGESRAVYGLGTVRIPTNRSSKRRAAGTRFCRSTDDKWSVVIKSAEAAARSGRPVLIGTRSVSDSERVSALLSGHGLAHVVLNARQDEDEALTIAAAGKAGQITVATNMAGRGTDIRLGDGVAETGGLHVILTEFHESSRIDRQLFGRAGRQGDPGSYEAIVSLEDEIFQRFAPPLVRTLGASIEARTPRIAGMLLKLAAQRGAERTHRRARHETMRRDQELDRLLAFAGRPD
jgi:preprotein translocase subunit SecA